MAAWRALLYEILSPFNNSLAFSLALSIAVILAPCSLAWASSIALNNWVFNILGINSATSSSFAGSKIKSAFLTPSFFSNLGMGKNRSTTKRWVAAFLNSLYTNSITSNSLFSKAFTAATDTACTVSKFRLRKTSLKSALVL